MIAIPALDSTRNKELAVPIYVKSRGKKWRQGGDKSGEQAAFETCRMQKPPYFTSESRGGAAR